MEGTAESRGQGPGKTRGPGLSDGNGPAVQSLEQASHVPGPLPRQRRRAGRLRQSGQSRQGSAGGALAQVKVEHVPAPVDRPGQVAAPQLVDGSGGGRRKPCDIDLLNLHVDLR